MDDLTSSSFSLSCDHLVVMPPARSPIAPKLYLISPLVIVSSHSCPSTSGRRVDWSVRSRAERERSEVQAARDGVELRRVVLLRLVVLHTTGLDRLPDAGQSVLQLVGAGIPVGHDLGE